MKKQQKNIFLDTEGNNWFDRNKIPLDKKQFSNDRIIEIIEKLDIPVKRLLEVGCANGKRLDEIRKKYNADVYGIEPSALAIKDGAKLFPKVNFQQGTAENLPFENDLFDVVVFGFCLYLCDREDLFTIAAEADRVLRNNGVIIILDFNSKIPYQNDYIHYKGIKSFKMEYSKMFLWNPNYYLKYKHLTTHNGENNILDIDDQVSIEVISKSLNTYIKNPYAK